MFEIFFWCIIFVPLFRTSLSFEFYLYDTERSNFEPYRENHCLLFSIRREWSLSITIDFCLRPSDDQNDDRWNENMLPIGLDKKFTFEQLSRLNTTSEKLISWSIPSELIEDYQFYLLHRNEMLSSKEIFRCVQPWFGSRCQYSFNIPHAKIFFDIILKMIKEKLRKKSLAYPVYSSCYIHLECQNNGIPSCLQWNQICDGQIDCIDGEQDEKFCSILESNECNENEYRCHNGLCIPKDFLDNTTPECLDQSDIFQKLIIRDSYEQMIDFLWKEHGCQPGDQTFTCGDGQCVEKYHSCQNGRHQQLIDSIRVQGNLNFDCWLLMLCLTKMNSSVNDISCQKLHESINFTSFIEHCEKIIEFPTKPVLLHHVRFLYNRDHLTIKNLNQMILPDYICYDRHLCEHLQPTFFYHHFTCRYAHEMGLHSSQAYSNWVSIIDTIRPYFYGCMIPTQSKSQFVTYSRLYCCRNSSKCISKHRLIDGIIDCPYQDDEESSQISCSIKNNNYRFKCYDEDVCHSPILPRSICPPRENLQLHDLFFHEICDRNTQLTPQLHDKQNLTDETECQHWQCNTIYSRCDYYWHCPNGEDEIGCFEPTICPNGTFQCVSPLNYTIICLPAQQVADYIVDCFGAADEQILCRNAAPTIDFLYPRFRCWNSSKCLIPADICDDHIDCPFGDDEIFCNGSHHVCASDKKHLQTALQKNLCQLAYGSVRNFLFQTLEIYPSIKTRTINASHIESIKSKTKPILIQSNVSDLDNVWYCHDGLSASVRVSSTIDETACFCPPSFFGDRCQYQSQRVSVTLQVSAVRKRGIHSFLISLLSDDDHDDDNNKNNLYHKDSIHSYHQTSHVLDDSCGKTFKFSLLYSKRQKNLSSNYFVKIDAFNQTSLLYLASWRYRIPFNFLPVNPVVVSIRVPGTPLSISKQCREYCQHGQCMKYLNDDTVFCHCDRGWEGKRCDYRIDCNDCSSDAICVGSYRNRSLCVCPINRFGKRCLLNYSCPENICSNGGQCIVTEPSKSDKSYACACPEKYQGVLCHVEKNTLQLIFKNVQTPPYIILNIFHIRPFKEDNTTSSVTMIAQKLRMFQTSTVIYIHDQFQIVLVEANNKQYLVVVQESTDIRTVKTIISPERHCPHFQDIADVNLIHLPEIRRVKYYHQLCQLHHQLKCFLDESYLCLCTSEHHANCLLFKRNFTCHDNVHCLNGAQCFQDRPDCPVVTFCICSDCFFGDRCQFYAKGIGLTLDDMLRYELQPSINFLYQSVAVRLTAGLAIFMFLAGLINSALCLLAFHQKASQQVGAGVYLWTSSITSLLTVGMLNVKVWFLIITQLDRTASRIVLRMGCKTIEPTLKFFLYMDQWLNACVALERAMAVYQATKFNKSTSKRLAKWIILILFFFIFGSLLPEFGNRDLFDDEEEERIWCVLPHSASIIGYSSFISLFHTLLPFAANLLSVLFIIFRTANRRCQLHERESFINHLRKQLKENRHLLVGPVILTILSSPRVIISFLAECVKDNRSPWLYLSGYLISFIPTMVIFLVFVVPSPLYRQEFTKSTQKLFGRNAR